MIAPGRPKWRYRAAVIAAVLVIAAVSGGLAFWPRRATTTPEEALYWRATTAATATDAEHDLGTFVATYPSSPRYDDALLRLAQLELSRGDRAGAQQHLALLAKHAPVGIVRTRALVMGSVAALDAADTTGACQTIAPVQQQAAAGDSSLSRQLTNITATCATHTAALGPTPADSSRVDSAAVAPGAPAAPVGTKAVRGE